MVFFRFKGYNNFVFEALGRMQAANVAFDDHTYRALMRICARSAIHQ